MPIPRPKDAPDHLRMIWTDDVTPARRRYLFSYLLPDLTGYEIRLGGYYLTSQIHRVTCQAEANAFVRFFNGDKWKLLYADLSPWSEYLHLYNWPANHIEAAQLSFSFLHDPYTDDKPSSVLSTRSRPQRGAVRSVENFSVRGVAVRGAISTIQPLPVVGQQQASILMERTP